MLDQKNKNPMPRLLWWRKTPEQIAEEKYLEGWEGVPESPKKRRKMTPTQLAISLSKCKKDSPAHILYDHELKLAIVKRQNRATYVAAISAIIGAAVGGIIGLYSADDLTTSTPPAIKHDFKCDNKKAPRNNADNSTKDALPSKTKVVPADGLTTSKKNNPGDHKKETTKPKQRN